MRYVISGKLERPRVIVGHCGHCEEDKKSSEFADNIEKKTLDNKNFREVLSTNEHSQLVVMSLKPGEDIGEETHDDTDQFFRVEAGKGKFILEGGKKEIEVEDGDAVIVPAGTKHNVVNTSDSEDFKVYTIYSPPQHPDGTIHKTKEDAQKDEKEH